MSTLPGGGSEIITKIGALFIHHSLGLVLSALIVGKGVKEIATLASFGVSSAFWTRIITAVVSGCQLGSTVPAIAAFVVAHLDRSRSSAGVWVARGYFLPIAKHGELCQIQ